MPKITVDDGVAINYHLDDFTKPWDEKRDVLLLAHGSSENSKFYLPIVPHFATQYRVLRYDARGRGESTFPKNGLTLSGERGSVAGLGDRLVKDPLVLLDALGIDKVHWVGVSSGGITAAQFAATHPERVKSLVLCTTPYMFPADLARAWAIGETDMAVAIEKFGLKEWFRRSNFIGGTVDTSKSTSRLIEWQLAERNKLQSQVYADFQRWILKHNIAEFLPNIKCPTLIMAAEKSNIASLEQQRFMQQQIPNAKLVIFPGIGHSIHLLETDRFISETLQFIEGAVAA